jgi:hypothetical protein
VQTIGAIQNNLAFHVSCVEEVAIEEPPATAETAAAEPREVPSASTQEDFRSDAAVRLDVFSRRIKDFDFSQSIDKVSSRTERF